MHFRFFRIDAVNAPVEHYMYEGTTVSANGTTVIPLNMNRTSLAKAVAVLTHAPTVTAVGTEIDYQLVTGNRTVGGVGESGRVEFLLAPDTNYLFRLINSSGVANTLGYTMEWNEP